MSDTENNEITSPKLALPALSTSLYNETQICWICFCTNLEDLSAKWVQPCKCNGTVKWAHQACLLRWVDEKQKGNSLRPVKCPHCLTEYIIIVPRMGFMIGILNEIEEIIKVSCPFLAAGVAIIIIFWTSVTYGAITVLEIVGFDEGIRLLENIQPLALIIGLPAIPISLVLGQLIRWDHTILTYMRHMSILSTFDENSNRAANSSDQLIADSFKPLSGARVFCMALVLPTVSVIMGKVLFKSIQSNLVRTLFGGLSFIAIKGTLNIILQQSELVRKRRKMILDYNENNLEELRISRLNEPRSEPSSVSSDSSYELVVLENILPL